MKNSEVKAGYVKPGASDVTSTAEIRPKNAEREIHKKLEAANNKRRVYTKLTERIAQDDLCIGNEQMPRSKELWPLEWKMHFAKLFYPSSKMFFDMPTTKWEVDMCERKMEINKFKEFADAGYKYVYILAGDDEFDVRARMGDKEAIEVVKDRKMMEEKRKREREETLENRQ